MNAAVLLMYVPGAYGEGVPAIPVTSGACRVAASDNVDTVVETREITARIVSKSFPKLAGREIDVTAFESATTFFKNRFSITHYLSFRGTRIMLSVNPCVFKLDAPPDGIEAIIAHELAHAENYVERNAIELLGLITLMGGDSLARFERRMDLVTIARGYAPGLIEYRQWLYRNVTESQAEKKRRNYFSPEEITALDAIMRSDPERYRGFYRRVPLGMGDLVPASKGSDIEGVIYL